MVVQLALQCFSEKEILPFSKRYIYLENLTEKPQVVRQADLVWLIDWAFWLMDGTWGQLGGKKNRKKTQSPHLYFFKFYQKLIYNYLAFSQTMVELKDLFCDAYWVICS